MNVYVLLVVMTLLGAVASFFLKKASGKDSIIKIAFDYHLYLGGMLYVLSAILNIYLLKHMKYSVVLPLTAITYIWTMIISYIKLNEKITTKKVLGTLLIIVGASFMTR